MSSQPQNQTSLPPGAAAVYDMIIVGAGVVGPALAHAMALQGRRVALIERDLREPNRIVGELLQPAGLHALERLGLASCVEGIDAIPEIGYTIFYEGQSVKLPYPPRGYPSTRGTPSAANAAIVEKPGTPLQDIIKVRENGVSFHHGRFIMNLRKAAAKHTDYVDVIEATVTATITEEEEVEPPELLAKKRIHRRLGRVVGVRIKQAVGADKSVTEERTLFAPITVIADGTTSKFRKEYTTRSPVVKSHFVGVVLDNAELVAPNHGHVLLGTKFAPVLVYQIGTTETRALFDIQGKLPSISNGDMAKHLTENVVPYLPQQLQPSMRAAIDKGQFRSMPNQFLPTSPQRTPGVIVLGDAWNMRHPLTGGGMTVALNDVDLLRTLLRDTAGTLDWADWDAVQAQVLEPFYWRRKNLGAVVNILAQALYALFAANSEDLYVLQRGCFRYFERGGACVADPVSLLSGILPRPLVLFNHFFAVAFYAIYCNFCDAGLAGFPGALLRSITVLYTATIVILPYILEELKWY
ncbi:uncharacterized protein SAPINGB_P003657 [Magnusiomyces paraingens]|uniref:Squalene monooxygenase n=1 Tax=Magnusiomyces paraingens TaxID=2606893 RepID=A0A5E8BQK2_9ASCO|nr:uncharacterized protein SAPINGB_P003657 [Saprochaete ingens]VVT53603.1 unnamed protein product [Saprochaete ingens]